ncbi:hypothetical protein SAMN04487913_11775 [Arthrobacter sp. ok362]|nr:hypothetical protein SAMN04487913_11775 [Arthrobacter sp. ok362]
MRGAMQYGGVNNADPELTELRSTGAVSPGGATPNAGNTTLLVTNPGVGIGVQVGEWPAIGSAGIGVISSGNAKGLWARASQNQFCTGIDAEGRNGVRGVSLQGDASDAGVEGTATGFNSNGLIGEANNGPSSYGVWGKSTTGLAGAFYGRVHVFGTLTKSGGGFQIDCPGRETERYLNHSYVESDDMKNLYDGMATLDENGSAQVVLPEWFSGLNQDYRYQLTSVGQPAPNLHIAEEISKDGFLIAGGLPGSKVSWQVTGNRKDAWAERNRIPVEEPKPHEMLGRYLHPEVFGKPDTEGEQYLREEMLNARRKGINGVQPGDLEPDAELPR